jgi:hypothetical protein
MDRRTSIGVILGSMSLLSGCNPFGLFKRESIEGEGLPTARMSTESFGLEVYFIRFPLHDPEMNGKLWESVDEQSLPVDVRRRLEANGLRAGMVSKAVPEPLRARMNPDQTAAESEESQVLEFDKESTVRRRWLAARSGQRNEILASDVLATASPLVVAADGAVSGRTFSRAQGVFSLKARPEPDGRVRLELVPEFAHGDPVQKFVPGDGNSFRVEASRPREVYDGLKMEFILSPGEMVVVSARAELTGSLGRHFLTSRLGEAEEQKLLVIRLAQTQTSALFAAR